METSGIMTPEMKSFIQNHIHEDVNVLSLRFRQTALPFSLNTALTQIECRRKCRKKLKNLIAGDGFLFPDELAAEQATHEAVASYHASLIGTSGSLLDMTGGLGVDAMTLSKCFDKVTVCELDELRFLALCNNSKSRKLDNVEAVLADSVEFLASGEKHFDWIFVDPARRVEGRKVYGFQDCLPDIVANQDMISGHCGKWMVKASPMLDISHTIGAIRNISFCRVVCLNGECKEVLLEVDKSYDGKILFESVDLDENAIVKSSFQCNEIGTNPSVYADMTDIKAGSYIYEPNAALMKLSPWKALLSRYPALRKLSVSSHLFVSPQLYSDFPGRIFLIESLVDKKERKALKGFPANVIVRNYPLSASELRKQLGIAEGEDEFVIGTRLSRPVLLKCRRVRI